MNVFDYLNKLIGRPSTTEIREEKRKREYRQFQDELYRNPPKREPPAPRKFTSNDPEYWLEQGLATTEVGSQQMVNDHRERNYPGIKPLFPEVQALPRLEKAQPLALRTMPRRTTDEERRQISVSRY